MTPEIEERPSRSGSRNRKRKRHRDPSQNRGVGVRTNWSSGLGGDLSGRGSRTRTTATTPESQRCRVASGLRARLVSTA